MTIKALSKARPARARKIKPEIDSQKVARVAYVLYLQRGCIDGHDKEDWFNAERIVSEQRSKKRR